MLITMVMLLWRPIKGRGKLMGGCVFRLSTTQNVHWREMKTSREVDYCLEVRENVESVFEDVSCLVAAQLIMRLKHAK